MAVGPGVVAVLLTTIVSTGRWFDGRNLALALTILATIAVRWLEFMRGNSRTADDEPATPTHLVRYTLLWLVCGAVAWAVVNGVAQYLRSGV